MIASALLDGMVQGVVVHANADADAATSDVATSDAVDVGGVDATSAMLFCNPSDGCSGNLAYIAVLVWSSYLEMIMTSSQ